MPKYLFRASYTKDGLKGLIKEGGSARRDTVTKLIEGMGGKVEAFYYALGPDDVVAIGEMTEAQVVAVSLTINASGSVKLSTTKLLDPAEVDQATKISVDYRPPGK